MKKAIFLLMLLVSLILIVEFFMKKTNNPTFLFAVEKTDLVNNESFCIIDILYNTKQYYGKCDEKLILIHLDSSNAIINMKTIKTETTEYTDMFGRHINKVTIEFKVDVKYSGKED